MHLCLVSPEYPPIKHGGIGSLTCDLAESLVKVGHRVTVVGLFPKDDLKGERLTVETRNGVKVVRLADSFWRKWPYKLVFWWDRVRLKKWINQAHRQDPFDLVESTDYDGFLPWGAVEGIPLILRLNGSNALYDAELGRKGNSFMHSLELKMLNKAHFWVGASQWGFDQTLKLTGLPKKNGTVIYNTVDTEIFSPAPSVPIEEGSIVFVNSINPRKGVGELIQACEILFPKYPKAKLFLVGNDNGPVVDGKKYLERMKSQLKPEFRERVIETGKRLSRPEVIPYLQRAHVCCYPSHAEMFAIAPLEAMALEKPTVYSIIGPGREAIEHGVSGLLCDPHDPRDIAAKIGQIFDQPASAAKMAKAGRERVVKLFSRADWIPRNVTFFEKCLAEFNGNKK